ncbi:chromate efflux transporter [Corynebacterium hansenii]|uniref:Chromate efflux transporter n=1 Tax=Corynebacterium hansenii TaxID=394964 RepID=A0ABV7ZPI5_9CORY|nr:chromate efflux transporter [Corynebacterium hansenii]WJZ00625.1 putative chromate transport protein [Corynebacterium hansenii]
MVEQSSEGNAVSAGETPAGAAGGEPGGKRGSVGEVFSAFGLLGLTSFGGPVAHLGYFREEFVGKRRWLTDSEYADVVALCQFLPGPASSQVGMALGWRRAGLPGMLAAFIGFTTPSAVVLALAAVGVAYFGDLDGPIAGLKAAAVAVVAVALWGMAKNLVTSRLTAALALGAMALTLLAPGGWGAWAQVGAIVVAGVIGLAFIRGGGRGSGGKAGKEGGDGEDGGGKDGGNDESAAEPAHLAYRVPAWASIGAAVAFFAVMALAVTQWWGTYYWAGALVFGGGHVVLPLLEGGLVPGAVDADTFLAGYGLAQAVPGPLFTFASYLGMASGGVLGALIATLAIFLPSMLLLIAVMPVWAKQAANPKARGAVAAINAAVVGLLAAAFYDPVWTHGISGPGTFVVAVAALAALTKFKLPAWAVVLAAGAIGWVAF